jgi:hypothetical protein
VQQDLKFDQRRALLSLANDNPDVRPEGSIIYIINMCVLIRKIIYEVHEDSYTFTPFYDWQTTAVSVARLH